MSNWKDTAEYKVNKILRSVRHIKRAKSEKLNEAWESLGYKPPSYWQIKGVMERINSLFKEEDASGQKGMILEDFRLVWQGNSTYWVDVGRERMLTVIENDLEYYHPAIIKLLPILERIQVLEDLSDV